MTEAAETREALRPDRALTDPMELRSTDTRGALVPSNAGEAMEMAKIMATGRFSVPSYLHGNPGDCLRLVILSARTGLDAFMLANESYLTKARSGEERMEFQAKAIHAITLASGILDGDLQTPTEGEGTAMKCTVTGKRRGGSVHSETYNINTIEPKNSPLWKTQPRQQLIYYAERAWCRAHAPDALMGLIAREDPQIIAGPAEAATAPRNDTERVEQALGAKDVTDADYEVLNGEPDSGPSNEAAKINTAEVDPFADGVPVIDENGEVKQTRRKPMPWFGDLQTMIANSKEPQALIELNRAGAEHWCREDQRSESLWQQCREDAEQREREPALGV